MDIHELVALQRSALASDREALMLGQGSDWQADYARRRQKLCRLRELLIAHEAKLLDALHKDLGKSQAEGYLSEFGFVLSELRHTLGHLKRWMKPRSVRSSLSVFPSRSVICPEPYGVVLIMSPWNYPLQLSLCPLISAVAAGNRCVLKPSNMAPHTAQAMTELLAEWTDQSEVAVVQGGREENQRLLDERFDYIFFTGGATVGRLVMQKAAEHLTPVTLELGGKSPCIVDDSADIALAARRIAFGKALNAGQTCVAPDYLLVQRGIKNQLLLAIREAFIRFYGENALKNPDWPKIVNTKHYERLMGLLKDERLYWGGGSDGERIAPTILDEVTWDAPCMQEEIFGPLLPVISYDSDEELLNHLRRWENPLALYIFSRDERRIQAILRAIPFGGGCVNDTLMHLSNPNLPFGGVGASGMGAYHGKRSFDTFSHLKGLLYKGKTDFSFRYPPYTDQKLRWLRRALK